MRTRVDTAAHGLLPDLALNLSELCRVTKRIRSRHQPAMAFSVVEIGHVRFHLAARSWRILESKVEMRRLAPCEAKLAVAKTVELPSGIRLPYVAQGDPTGIPMLLLHGVTDSWRSFECVFPYLPRSIRAIAPTQRGHGDADESSCVSKSRTCQVRAGRGGA